VRQIQQGFGIPLCKPSVLESWGRTLEDAQHLGPYHLRYTVPCWLYRLTDAHCVHLNRASNNKLCCDKVIDLYLLSMWLLVDT
jgi:hypothetical protein